MKHLKKLLIPLTAFFCAFILSGCYTKIASYQNETIPSSGSGGCVDCRDEAPASDRRQICVWERDIFGFPEMRCYYTNYASSWMYFHSTPWWYRSNYGWYDTRGCPAYYYYDRTSGICRYYGGSYSSGGGSGGSSQPSGGSPPARRNSRVAPDDDIYAPSGSGSPMFTGGARTLSPAGSRVTSGGSNSGSGQGTGVSKTGEASADQPQDQDQPPQRSEPPARRSGRVVPETGTVDQPQQQNYRPQQDHRQRQQRDDGRDGRRGGRR
jgi:hypothetical protein